MAAGLAQLRELERIDAWNKLEQLGTVFEDGVRKALAKTSKNYTFNRIGSMFCLFFTDKEIRNLDDAKTSDLEAFKKYFAATLENGIYFAPSQFETGFISTAHTEADIATTAEVAAAALASL